MHRSRLYGLFIDTPTDQAEQSHRFWSAALGVPAQPVPGEEQFTMLPGVLGDLVVGVQAVADAPRYHLDIETDDVDAEVARLTALGAVEVARWLDCHVLRAPGGHLLCVIPVHSDPALFAAEAKVWNTYRYIGPAELRGISGPNPASITVESTSALAAWLNGQPHTEPFTFVVDLAGHLRLAPRRSEHVALSAGQDVLAAGEMAFDRHGNVSMVSNQSTGYCPDPGCWPAVGRTLDALGIAHPRRFTHEIVFSRCTECGQRNIVRDNDFTCAVCDSPLPSQRR